MELATSPHLKSPHEGIIRQMEFQKTRSKHRVLVTKIGKCEVALDFSASEVLDRVKELFAQKLMSWFIGKWNFSRMANAV